MTAFMTWTAQTLWKMLKSALRITAMLIVAFVSAALLTAAFDNGPADALEHLRAPDVSTSALPPG